MEELKKKINWKMLLGVTLIIVLVIECFVISNLSKKVSNLEGQISYWQTQGDYIRSEISSIYDNVEEKLKKEASLISSVDYELGAINSITQKAEVKFTVVPKNIMDEMTLSVSIGDEMAGFSRDGNGFTAILKVGIFLKYGSYPILTVKTAEGTKTEQLKNVPLDNLYQSYLPDIQANFWGKNTAKKNSLKIDGNVSLDCAPSAKESNISFKKIELVTELNEKEVDREVIFLKLVDGECEHSIQETYKLDEGDNLIMYVEAEDTAGFIHRTGWYSWAGDDDSRYGKEIYDKDGNLLISE